MKLLDRSLIDVLCPEQISFEDIKRGQYSTDGSSRGPREKSTDLPVKRGNMTVAACYLLNVPCIIMLDAPEDNTTFEVTGHTYSSLSPETRRALSNAWS